MVAYTKIKYPASVSSAKVAVIVCSLVSWLADCHHNLFFLDKRCHIV